MAKVGSAARWRRLQVGVSGAALVIGLASAPAGAASLPTSITPGQDNYGGSNPGRADIVTINGGTNTVTGNYSLGGSSARRFVPVSATLAQRQAAGDVISGYDTVNGQSSVALTAAQKRHR